MRNLKRFLALALTMLMVIGSFSLSAKSFADTAEMTTEQINALDLLSDLSIILGKDNEGNFGGADEISRKEMAILASRIQTGEKFGASYGENVTPFADVVSDFEAILYAHNMGIVIGFEDGTFRPEDKVIYQDVLTMIVRTLGYNGAAMDAGYPSTYINKARELGITKGITSTVIPSWTSNVARQDVATLLYNALFAVKADGTTAAEFFGIGTYVVTAVGDYNITGVNAHLANGTRVVVQPLNADGSINDMYYHIPVEAFTEADLTPVHGASYRIASTDNLATVKSISACPYVELADDADMTAELYDNGTVVITGADGKPVSYTAVKRYSKVYNNQGTHKADNEIIVYNQRGFNWTIGTNLVPYPNNDRLDPDENNSGLTTTEGLLTDAYGNLLDEDGFIVAYFVPEWVSLKSVQLGVIEGAVEGEFEGTSVDTNNGGATTTIEGSINGELIGIYTGASGILYPYAVYDAATGTYAPATAADIAKAAQTQDLNTRYRMWVNDNAFKNDKGVVVPNNSTFCITDKDDKYTAVAYDDNYDGKYDRLFFMYHTFGIGSGANGISVNSGFNPSENANDGGQHPAMSPYIADSSVAQGELVRFYADAARKQYDGAWQSLAHLTTAWATVVEKYETTTVTGMVTAVSGTKMTIGGNPYDIASMALHNFNEAIPYGKENGNKYIGQNVTAVLYDGGIFQIMGNTNTWVIFEDYTGLTTNGYVTALAFVGSNDMKNITIASIDGYFFMYNDYTGFTHTGDNSFETFYNKIHTAGIYAATVDTYGYYHLSSNANGVNVKKIFDNGPNNIDGAMEYTFAYGISSGVNFHYADRSGWERFGMFDAAGSPTFNQWSDKNDWEFIFYNSTTKSFLTGDGLPNDGSKITVFRSYKNYDYEGWYFSNDKYESEFWYLIDDHVVLFTDAVFEGSFGGNGSNTVNHQTDLVYLTAEAAANFSVDNTVPGLGGAGETIWGFRYVYNEAVSMLDGSKVKICTDGIYNYKLTAGFYFINNGVVDHKVEHPQNETDSAIVRGSMTRGDDWGFKIECGSGLGNSTHNAVYERALSPYKIVHINADGSLTSYSTRAQHSGAHNWTDGTTSVFFFEPTMYTNCPIIICTANCF